MEVFEPALYSAAELQFFLDHMGEPPVAALQGPLPPGVNPVVVTQVLGACYDHEQVLEHKNVKWVGFDAIKSSIEHYMEWDATCKGIAARGGPRTPSMHVWDARGRPHRAGTGADTGFARHSINTKTGARQRLGVRLRSVGDEQFTPSWVSSVEEIPTAFIHDEQKRTYECPICNWSTQYKPDSERDRRMGYARAVRHCTAATTEKELHHEFKLLVKDSSGHEVTGETVQTGHVLR